MFLLVPQFREFNFMSREFRRKMSRVEEYMDYRQLPESLRRRVREFYTYNRRVSSAFVVHEREILHYLSRALRDEVTKLVNRRMLDIMPSMICANSNFNLELILAMESRCFPPRETLCQSDKPNDEVFILM